MTFGIYIVGNDNVAEEVIALVNSIRFYNKTVSITLIPYSDDYQKVLNNCSIELFPDLDLLKNLDTALRDTFSLPTAPIQANKYSRLKNLAGWFGHYDQFISLDADIVAMTDLEEFGRALFSDYDFVNYDRTYLHGVKWVFTNEIYNIFSKERLKHVFNNGFWVSRKGLFEFKEILEHLRRCKERYRYFDFANGVIAQPIINYLLLERIDIRMYNPLLIESVLPEPWVGFKYKTDQHRIYKEENGLHYYLPFIHWAGKEIQPPYYYDVWKFYNELTRNDSSG